MSSEHTPSTIATTEATGFVAPIADAYPFRCHMEFVGAMVNEIHMTVENKMIRFSEQDSHGTVLIRTYIYTENMVDFYLNPEYESISVGVDMRTFRTKIKKAQKKQSVLTLFNSMDVPTEFYATFTVPNQGVHMSVIPTVRLPEHAEIDVPDYGDDPSLVVPVAEVSRTFGCIADSRCKYAEVVCYARGILLKAIVNGKVEAVEMLGKVLNPYTAGEARAAEYNGEPVTTYIISNATIKPFAKINNISPTSATLKLYYVQGYPLKLMYPLGTCGTVEVYLTSVDPTTMKPAL